MYWVHLDNPGHDPHLKILNLITPVSSLLSCKVPCPQFPGFRCGHFARGGHHSSCHTHCCLADSPVGGLYFLDSLCSLVNSRGFTLLSLEMMGRFPHRKPHCEFFQSLESTCRDYLLSISREAIQSPGVCKLLKGIKPTFKCSSIMGEVGTCERQRYPGECQGSAVVSIKVLPNFDSHIQCPESANCADISTRKLIHYSRMETGVAESFIWFHWDLY